MYPKEYLYSKEHEWLDLDGDVCTVGITEFAQKELGEVVYVELPEAGATFDAHDEIGTIESVKAVAEVYTPVGGEIVEINEALVDAPEMVNDNPHDDAWLVKIKVSDPAQVEALMDAAAYQEFCAKQ